LDYWLAGQDIADNLLFLRKEYAKQRDDMLKLQKENQEDKNFAKFFKEEAKDRLKLYRACCLLIPHVTQDFPGDCEYKEPYLFPEELYSYLDLVAGLADVRRG
jgi:hypothetical protein